MNNKIKQAINKHQDGKLDEAEKLYREILNNEPKNIDANHNLGVLLATRNQIEDALPLFKLATDINSNKEQFWANYINALIKINKLEEAKIISTKVIKLKPDFIVVHSTLGLILGKLGKLDEAEICYRRLIELKPELVDTYISLGAVLQKLNKLQDAETCCRKVLELKPESANACINLSAVLQNLNKLEEAETYCRKAIKLKPDYSEAYSNLGTILQNSANFDEAEKAYKKAIELKPEFIASHDNLRILLNFKKLSLKIKEAKNIYKKSVNKTNLNTRLKNNFFTSTRNVETALINSLYEISSKELNQTKGVFYGNGRHSTNFQLFEQLSENNYPIIKKVEEDLIDVMRQAVNSDIFIMDSFFNILKNGGGSVFHTHLTKFDKINNLVNQKYSLTYYLRVGDQECDEPGILKLKDPDKEILPSQGMIMIFPANQKHSAFYSGKSDRVMIGVNFYSLI